MIHLTLRSSVLFVFLFILVGIRPNSAIAASTTIFSESFETDGNGTRYTTSDAEYDSGDSFFTRTDGTNISATYQVNGQDGNFYFAASDLSVSNPTLTITGIDITGIANLKFNGDFAEDDASDGNEDWDSTDSVIVQAQVDGGGFETILQFEAVAGSTNSNNEPAQDTNFDGTGDSPALTSTFATFVASIAGTGSTLDLRITITNLTAADEDIAFDNLRITGEPSGNNLFISATDSQKAEGDSSTTPFTFTVERNGDTTGATSVDYAVSGADSADFAGGTHPSGTVNFAAGEESEIITIDVVGDTDVELDEPFTVTISNPANGETIFTSSATTIIQNDDALQAGDIAIVALAGSDPELIALYARIDIPGNELIKLTDDGWQASGSFRGAEGTLTYTTPQTGLIAGTVVVLNDNGSWSVSDDNLGSVSQSGAFNIASGDSLIAYQGDATSPTFLYAVILKAAWDTDGTDTTTSAKPTNLAHQVATGSTKSNAAFTGNTYPNATFLSSVNTTSNWTSSNTRTDLPYPSSSHLTIDPSTNALIDNVTIANNSTVSCDFTVVQYSFGPGGTTLDSGEIPRHWFIGDDGNCGTLDVDLTFHYTDDDLATISNEALLKAYRYDGSNTTGPFGTVNTTTNSVSVEDISELSNWTVATEEPTAIELDYFTATASRDGTVVIDWQTSQEVDHTGFNIYRRAVDSREAWTQVNDSLIASVGSQAQGAVYQHLDDAVTTGTWEYLLEDVETDGDTYRHLDFVATATVQTPTAVTLNNGQAQSAATLVQLLITLLIIAGISLVTLNRRETKVGR